MEAKGKGGSCRQGPVAQVYAARQMTARSAGVSAAIWMPRRLKSKSMMRKGVFFSAAYRAPDSNPRLPAICRLQGPAGTEDSSPRLPLWSLLPKTPLGSNLQRQKGDWQVFVVRDWGEGV